ncbi:DNA polymerase III subunit delta' [Anaerocolumna sp. AGMB13025]|uniref:DNA polymerase III subunit delta' n=1 Tax=Anaerocolumna sp. AGMB13025 TaxID=3039116 RepID=UPI00241D9109|nr:DNA polymerase III subunit delta' [Anaerocolumna sp. AGMB13025]WFR57466.1 DNA polymerase III subunit delta' [Anaerocolumna sp. AGMB13025]
MLDFNHIIGHEQIIQHLREAIRSGKVSHAYIFSGEDGAGKNLLSNAFAMSLQCEDREETKDGCGKCRSCIQAASDNHPDIIRVTHEKASIGVDDVRIQINNDILVKPYSSTYKIYIIDEAEKLTEAAQNALLKTIEEPPAYAVIMLLTNNLNALLPTILSRCITLKLKAVDKELMKQYLMTEYKVPDYQAELSAVFAQGNVGKAVKYASSEDFNERKNDVLHLLKYIDEMELYEVVDGLKRLSDKKDGMNDYLDLMLIWYRDVLMYKVTNDLNLLTYKSEYQDITKQASLKSYEGIEKIIAAIEKAKIRLNANVNFDIAIELMLFTIKENGNG